MKKKRKKALKQEKREAERQARAEALLLVTATEVGVAELQAAIAEAQGLAGLSAPLDAEVEAAKKRRRSGSRSFRQLQLREPSGTNAWFASMLPRRLFWAHAATSASVRPARSGSR